MTGTPSTRQAILAAGKHEFLEKGFRAASLRRIVREAGVTTGAFYGYFHSKQDLFRALVDEPAAVLMNRFRVTQERFAALPAQEQTRQMGQISGDCMDWMVGYVYEHFDTFKILLCGADGTAYAGFTDTMVEVERRATHQFMEVLRRLGHPMKPVDGQLEHILISGMFNAFFEMVVHDMPQRQAMTFIQDLRRFYSAGWNELLGL